ncbi:hypothetical protein [Microbacterium sp. P05]|uniref:hypothetical protein n=1 Tax=Microbacterium sp. P05 TaxID=3366948 RepID=UPI00374720B4
MDRIHYSGDSILTGTEIARAVLDYAQALAEMSSSDTVDIPTLSEDGTPGRSSLLLGPSSQLASDVEVSEHADISDDDLVRDLELRAGRVRQFGTTAPAPVAVTRSQDDDDSWSGYEVI